MTTPTFWGVQLQIFNIPLLISSSSVSECVTWCGIQDMMSNQRSRVCVCVKSDVRGFYFRAHGHVRLHKLSSADILSYQIHQKISSQYSLCHQEFWGLKVSYQTRKINHKSCLFTSRYIYIFFLKQVKLFLVLSAFVHSDILAVGMCMWQMLPCVETRSPTSKLHILNVGSGE